MWNNNQSPKFAQIIPMGVVATVCAVGALTVLSQNLVIACLLAILAFAAGIAALKMPAEN